MGTKVAVYTRVSTDHEEQLTSMKNQKEYYEKYCIDKGYELVKLYADEGLSGTSPKRKEFIEMLEDAGLNKIRDEETGEITFKISNRKPKFKYIITKDVSRFSRNINVIDNVRKLRDKGVYIIFENVDLTTEMSDWEFRLGLFLMFSQQESLDRSKKVSFAYKQRAEKGGFHMSRPLFGYERCPETKEYLINNKEAELVKEIFHMYVNENMGTKMISSELNKRGLKTRNGKAWRADGIKRMISNEKYKGQVVVNKYTTTGVTSSNRRIKRDDSEWFVYDDAIPAIVNKEIWDKAQDIMKERTNTTPNGNKVGSRTIKSIFHKKIKCPKCGADFIRIASKKVRFGEETTEFNYQCRNKRMHQTCNERGISHNVLERNLTKFAKEQFYNSLDIQIKDQAWMGEKIVEKLENKIEKVEEIRKELQNQIDVLDNNANKLLDDFLVEDVNENIKKAVDRKLEQFEMERNKLEKELAKNTTIEYQKYIEKVEKRFEEIVEVYEKKTFTFEDVLKYIDNIAIENESEHRYMQITLKIPSIKIFYLEQVKEGATKDFTVPIDEVESLIGLDRIKLD